MPLEMLGKYERLDVLGHGATGIVYLAKDTLLGKQVALKEISAQGDEKHRFLEEARVLDRLRHPNIVRVNSVDEIGGKVVIDMEYVRGRTLQDILRDTPTLPLAEAVGIAAQVCDGLAYAHSQRTVHRDIKPANILVTREGAVKLVDFGLAEVLGTHSFAGGAGTYAYMAPEDFHPEEQSDRQSDIWAVGVILYEMLAGRRPFVVPKSKDPFAWKQAVENDPISPLTSVRPDAPPALDAILARALARDKAQRYREAGSLARDLREIYPSASNPVGAGLAPALQSSAALSAPPAHPSFSVANGFLASLATIDDFLAAAPDHWDEARAAFLDGTLVAWLDGIGESPLAEVARQIRTEPDRDEDNRDDDDRLRDFLYRAGLETADEARTAFTQGQRDAKAGRLPDAVAALRRAAHLDPSRSEHFETLAAVLRRSGEAGGAAEVLTRAQVYHPAPQGLVREEAAPPRADIILSTTALNFGTLRQGQSRALRVTVQNDGGGGTLEGRVVSAPGWVRVEPPAFSTRRRQTLTLTARTDAVWSTPTAYDETVVLETSAGRQEIAVSVHVLPARLSLARISVWFLPLLGCAALPALVALRSVLRGTDPRTVWQAGWGATGLLFLSVFILTLAAEVTWLVRLLPLGLAGLSTWALGRTLADLGTTGPALPLVQTVTPVVVLLVLQTCALLLDGAGWGRWQLWRWIIGATALLAGYSLWHGG